MMIPTEPIGSIPRPLALIDAVKAMGDHTDPRLEQLYDDAIRDTIMRFEQTGSPVVTDGEQRKYHNFWTYCVHGLANTAPDGFRIPFAAGHARQMPRLTSGPFRYKVYADQYLDIAKDYANVPVKQAVISPSALSLMYPAEGIAGYPRDMFIDDLLGEHELEVRRCLDKGAHVVQIDFTEGRMALKLDPSGQLLDSFIDLNNRALARFSAEQRKRIGVHTCPGGDCNSTHSAEIDYADLLPRLLDLQAGNFYIALSGEADRVRVLKTIGRAYEVGSADIRRRRCSDRSAGRDSGRSPRPNIEAAQYIPIEQLRSTDDCGFAPFSDDTPTSRNMAFAKIRARVLGTALAEKMIAAREGGRRTGSEAAASQPQVSPP